MLPTVHRPFSLLAAALLTFPLAWSGACNDPPEAGGDEPADCPATTPEGFTAMYDKALGGGQSNLLGRLIAPEGLVANGGLGRPLRMEEIPEGVEAHAAAHGATRYESSNLLVVPLPDGQFLVRSDVLRGASGARAERTLVLRPGGTCGFEVSAELWREGGQP